MKARARFCSRKARAGVNQGVVVYDCLVTGVNQQRLQSASTPRTQKPFHTRRTCTSRAFMEDCEINQSTSWQPLLGTNLKTSACVL